MKKGIPNRSTTSLRHANTLNNITGWHKSITINYLIGNAYILYYYPHSSEIKIQANWSMSISNDCADFE